MHSPLGTAEPLRAPKQTAGKVTRGMAAAFTAGKRAGGTSTSGNGRLVSIPCAVKAFHGVSLDKGKCLMEIKSRTVLCC
jgi:hypothetical protein